jgi:hypothetical protein
MSLPEEFRDLEPFAGWALETRPERVAKLNASAMAEARAFYDAMLPRMPAVIGQLNKHPLGNIGDEADRRLYHLALAFMAVAQPIELGWDQTSNPGSFPFDRMPFKDE